MSPHALLALPQDMGHPDLRIRTLSQCVIKLVYEHVCTSLFKVCYNTCNLYLMAAALHANMCRIFFDMQCIGSVTIVADTHFMNVVVVQPVATLPYHIYIYIQCKVYMHFVLSSSLHFVVINHVFYCFCPLYSHCDFCSVNSACTAKYTVCPVHNSTLYHSFVLSTSLNNCQNNLCSKDSFIHFTEKKPTVKVLTP